MSYTYCEDCKMDMVFSSFDNEEEDYPDEIYRCPKCGEEAYVN